MTKTITNRNQLVLSVLLTIGAIEGIKHVNTGETMLAAVRQGKKIEVSSLLNGEPQFEANVYPETRLRDITWIKHSEEVRSFKKWDQLIDEQGRRIDLDQTVEQLPQDTDLTQFKIMRLLGSTAVLEKENAVHKGMHQIITEWNREIYRAQWRKWRVQELQGIIGRNQCLPDMEPMNKLLAVFAGACDPATTLTREHFTDWLDYMGDKEPEALHFLMLHDALYEECTPALFTTTVLRVLKSMHPIHQQIIVVRSNGTEFEMRINLNSTLAAILPWVTELRLLSNTRWFQNRPINLASNLNNIHRPNRLKIVEEISDPNKYVLEKLKAEGLYEQNRLRQLPEVKELMESELASLKNLKGGEFFYNPNYTGPEYNKVLSTIMKCLIELYDQLLKAEGNTKVAETNVGGWVDGMIKENPLLLRLITEWPTTSLCNQNELHPIITIVNQLAYSYYKKTCLPSINH